jgi:hypothetical protein
MGPDGEYLREWRLFGEFMLQKSALTISANAPGPQVCCRPYSNHFLKHYCCFLFNLFLFCDRIHVKVASLSFIFFVKKETFNLFLLSNFFQLLFSYLRAFRFFLQFRAAASVAFSIARSCILSCVIVTDRLMPVLLGTYVHYMFNMCFSAFSSKMTYLFVFPSFFS